MPSYNITIHCYLFEIQGGWSQWESGFASILGCSFLP